MLKCSDAPKTSIGSVTCRGLALLFRNSILIFIGFVDGLITSTNRFKILITIRFNYNKNKIQLILIKKLILY